MTNINILMTKHGLKMFLNVKIASWVALNKQSYFDFLRSFSSVNKDNLSCKERTF